MYTYLSLVQSILNKEIPTLEILNICENITKSSVMVMVKDEKDMIFSLPNNLDDLETVRNHVLLEYELQTDKQESKHVSIIRTHHEDILYFRNNAIYVPEDVTRPDFISKSSISVLGEGFYGITHQTSRLVGAGKLWSHFNESMVIHPSLMGSGFECGEGVSVPVSGWQEELGSIPNTKRE